MDGTSFNILIRAIDKLRLAIVNFVTTSAQFFDDSQTVTGGTMTLTNAPTFVFGVYLNGQRLTKTTDYTVSGVTVTFVSFTPAADLISVVYKY